MHSSDQFIESTLTMSAVDKLTPHQVGSLLTYGRRYQWYGLTGTAPEDDDDGNSASGVGSHSAAQEVGQRKIAEMKAKVAAQKESKPMVLKYTYPDRHQGNYAEWTNLKVYADGLTPEAQLNFQAFFQPYLSKNLSKSGVWLVPREKMQELLEKLVGDLGLEVAEER